MHTLSHGYCQQMKSVLILYSSTCSVYIRTGYDTLVTSRPEFHSLLLSRVPKQKIHMGKKIIALQQDAESVTITCEDKSTYTADILIGADGHYSDVRKALYKDMENDGLSAKVKVDEPQVHIMSYLGVAENLDPANYEGLGEPESHSDTIIGEGRGETWRYFTCTDNRVAWRFDYQSSTMTTEEIEAWKNSDYLTFPKEKINPEIRKFELAIMGTLGHMFDATPKERLSKIVLEENVPQNWYHKRTVLIGDGKVDLRIMSFFILDIPFPDFFPPPFLFRINVHLDIPNRNTFFFRQ